MRFTKLGLPIAIVLASLILGGSFYSIQVNKQESIERQQAMELEYKKNLDQEELELKKLASEKEHEDSRRLECLKIYQTESDKWNNTTGYEYVAEDDICYVSYKAKQGEWGDVSCEDIGKDWDYSIFGFDSKMTRDMWRRKNNCNSSEFEKEY